VPGGFLLVILALLFCGSALGQQIDLTDWFPFNPTVAVSAGSAVDASDLLVDVPGEDAAQVIDRRGFLMTAADGRFYFANTGRRARFFGTNLTFNTCFPPNADAPQRAGEYTGQVPLDAADQLATRLARMGINLVRFHHMDSGNRPRGIWDPAYPNDTQHLDPLQLRRLDYLIFQLKKRGIYSNINLHVSRFFRSGDGVAEYNRFLSSDYNKGATQFDPVMIELQKKYATDLLGHTNPYTGLRLADDPAVAFVEITNEDSLLYSFRNGRVHYDSARPETLPPYYSAELDRLWNQWLVKRYGNQAALAEAWRGAGYDSGNTLSNPGFESGLQNWSQNRQGAAQATYAAVADAYDGQQAARVDVTAVDGTNWHVQLLQRGLTIEAGQRYEVTFAFKGTAGFPINVILQRDLDPWTSYATIGNFTATGQWQVGRGSFRSAFSEPGHVQLVFNIGAATGTVWLDTVTFGSIAPIGLAADESLAAGTVGRPPVSDLGRYSDARVRDVAQFYFDTERDYFDDMRHHVRNVIGAGALVTGTAPYWFYPGDIEVQARLDFVDAHIYSDHPSWPAVPAWSATGWVMRNRSFALDPFNSLFNLAASAVAGKPFTFSETNEPFPNDYGAEWLLWMTAFGNFQDWDEILHFDYQANPDNYFPAYSSSFFSIAGNAMKAAQMPVAARIFLAGQNNVAAGRVDLAAGHDELMLAPSLNLQTYYQLRGVNPAVAFQTSVRIGRFQAANAPQYSLAASPPAVLAGDNGELTLDRTSGSAPVFQVNSPSLQALSGFLAGKTIRLPSMTVALRPGPAEFAVITLQPLDGRPLAASARLLLSTLTRHQNTGMVWNSTRTSVDNRWGGAPTIVEPLAGSIALRLKPGTAYRIYALDSQGKRVTEIAAAPGAANDEFTLLFDSGQQRTVWYELAAEQAPAGAQPAVNRGGAVNAASYTGPLAPGMIVSIFGRNLAGTTGGATRLPLPVLVGSTSVLIGGRPAPLLYVSPYQINAQVPFSVPPGDQDLVVNSDNGPSPAERVTVVSAAPGIFGLAPGAARRGDYVAVYGTGLGALASALPAGAAAGGAIAAVNRVTATIGGVPAEVTYAGAAPGLPGVNQVNVRVPPEAAAGVVPLFIQAAGRSSNAIQITILP